MLITVMAFKERPLPEFSIAIAPNEYGEEIHHLLVGGRDVGVIDWETGASGKDGYIDGVDLTTEAVINCKRLRKIAWPTIAQCMRSKHPDIESIQNPSGDIFPLAPA